MVGNPYPIPRCSYQYPDVEDGIALTNPNHGYIIKMLTTKANEMIQTLPLKGLNPSFSKCIRLGSLHWYSNTSNILTRHLCFCTPWKTGLVLGYVIGLAGGRNCATFCATFFEGHVKHVVHSDHILINQVVGVALITCYQKSYEGIPNSLITQRSRVRIPPPAKFYLPSADVPGLTETEVTAVPYLL